MKNICLTVVLSAFLGSSALAASAELEEALALMTQMRQDQCQRQKIRAEIFNAHKSHNANLVEKLGPELDGINKRMKPSEDRMKALKVAIRKNYQDQGTLETAEMNEKACN